MRYELLEIKSVVIAIINKWIPSDQR